MQTNIVQAISGNIGEIAGKVKMLCEEVATKEKVIEIGNENNSGRSWCGTDAAVDNAWLEKTGSKQGTM